MSMIASIIIRLIRLYDVLIVIWCVLTWIPGGIGFVDQLRYALGTIVEPYLRIFQRFIPPLGGIDFSPIVAILVLELVERLVLSILV